MYEQESEDVFVKVNVDTPTTLPPLEDAKFLGKIVTEEEQIAMDQERRRLQEEEELEERRRQEEEEERRQAYEEEWMGLDEQTIQLINSKLKQTRAEMMTRLEEKNEEYKQKVATLKNQKGKKK